MYDYDFVRDVNGTDASMGDVTFVAVDGTLEPGIPGKEGSVTTRTLVMVAALIIIAVVTFGGNAVVLLSFALEKKMRTKFNMFIFNLALTDIIVSLTTSFYAMDLLFGCWPFSELLCGVWIFFDWGMTFLSIFTLMAVSLDRYWAACYSVHYRANNTRCKNVVILSLTW